MATNDLKVDALDFDTIKTNLKSFLKSQDKFKDYDFDGSGLSVLLDILAYNTHYQGFYAQQLANEAFIGTAVTKSAVVANAKTLGYTPTSITAPTAVVDVEFATQPTSDVISFGTKFTTTINGTTYNFIADKDYSIVFDTVLSKYVAKNVNIKEGAFNFFSYVADLNDQNQKFLIPTNKADTSTLIVRVQNSKTDTTGFTDVWQRSTNVSDSTSESKVYYLDQNQDGKYEVYFGDGIISQSLNSGNLVILQYLVTSGPDSNGAGKADAEGSRTFSFQGNLEATATVKVVGEASGGSLSESIESIRFNAPKMYQTQNRAVTSEDYQAILRQEYGDIESVFVWGGEENDPPEYGKVFIAVKPVSGNELTVTEKESIARKVVDGKNIIGIIPVVVDPDTRYLIVDTNVYYDQNKTVKSPDAIKELVRSKIVNFGDNNLEKFGRGFRYSTFVKEIDSADVSILSNNTTVKVQKRLTPTLNSTASYTIDFITPLHNPHAGHASITDSTSFEYYDSTTLSNKTSFLDDDGNGNIRIYYLDAGVKKYITESAGTINYTTGKIELVNFRPISISSGDSFIKVTVLPGEPAGATDIKSIRDQILTIDSTDSTAITISVSQDVLDKEYQNTGVSLSSTTTQSTTTTQTTQTETNISTSGSYY